MITDPTAALQDTADATLADPSALWTKALGELQLQMTQATFDTWLRDSRCLSCDNGTVLIEVRSGYAKDWLENRLLSAIRRTLTRLTGGQPVTVRFTVQETQTPSNGGNGQQQEGKAAARATGNTANTAVIELETLLCNIVDPMARQAIQRRLAVLRGEKSAEDEPASLGPWVAPGCDTSTHWFKVPEYTTRFWAPLLGTVAYRVWEIVRQRDMRKEESKQRDPWSPPQRFTAPELAAMVPCGRHAISGMWRKALGEEHPRAAWRTPENALSPDDDQPREPGWYVRQIGALERLEGEGLARIDATGERRHRLYAISVLATLPLLSPVQVSILKPELQLQHDRWLEFNGVTVDEWVRGQ